MKKFAKLLPYLIIICCVVFIVLTLLKVDERAHNQFLRIKDLESENELLTEQLDAVTAELDAAKAAAIDSDLALAEANGRLEQAETALSDMLAVVQLIREELNGAAAEEEAVVEEEAPAEEVTEAVENEEAVTEEVPAEETTDEAAAPEEAA